jgi:hypothetical protein
MQPKLVTLSYSPSDRLHVDECERRSERLLLATGLPICRYEVVNTYPHDPEAFTQGLTYKDGFLFESTGGWGRSSIRQVRIEDGAVLKRSALPPSVFGEGLVFWEGEIIVSPGAMASDSGGPGTRYSRRAAFRGRARGGALRTTVVS